mmetsp:Transcript_17046/g.49393  ORF Transcript_17046/g.49393 Transcript_17046/m.49393 type:complete len:308 (-) Transcript_17046:51-974(-)
MRAFCCAEQIEYDSHRQTETARDSRDDPPRESIGRLGQRAEAHTRPLARTAAPCRPVRASAHRPGRAVRCCRLADYPHNERRNARQHRAARHRDDALEVLHVPSPARAGNAASKHATVVVKVGDATLAGGAVVAHARPGEARPHAPAVGPPDQAAHAVRAAELLVGDVGEADEALPALQPRQHLGRHRVARLGRASHHARVAAQQPAQRADRHGRLEVDAHEREPLCTVGRRADRDALREPDEERDEQRHHGDPEHALGELLAPVRLGQRREVLDGDLGALEVGGLVVHAARPKGLRLGGGLDLAGH